MIRRGALAVLAKAPRRGLVKTRLCPPLSSEEAAELQAVMLEDVLTVSAEAARCFDLEPVLIAHPPELLCDFVSWIPRSFRIWCQRGHDLAARMTWAAAELGAAGFSPILLRGSDSPALPVELIRRTLEELEVADVVLTPDGTGGYALAGMRRPARGLFDHPMSTESVLEDTAACARALGLEVRVSEGTLDVDTSSDLVRLAAARKRGETDGCPRTVAWLDEHGLWPARERSVG